MYVPVLAELCKYTSHCRAASSAGPWLAESRKSNCNPPSGYITLNVGKILLDKRADITARKNKSLTPYIAPHLAAISRWSSYFSRMVRIP